MDLGKLRVLYVYVIIPSIVAICINTRALESQKAKCKLSILGDRWQSIHFSLPFLGCFIKNSLALPSELKELMALKFESSFLDERGRSNLLQRLLRSKRSK